MSKRRSILAAIIALAAVIGLGASAISYDWGVTGSIHRVPFGLDDGILLLDSINFQMFEVWGPVLLVLGTLMFGAIIAGVCISKEEEAKKEGEE